MFKFAFPPTELIPRLLAKAWADGLCGVMVLPFVTSHQEWQAFEAASLSSVEGQRDPCVKVPVNADFVTNAEVLRGTQKLAMLAVDFMRTLSLASARLAGCVWVWPWLWLLVCRWAVRPGASARLATPAVPGRLSGPCRGPLAAGSSARY